MGSYYIEEVITYVEWRLLPPITWSRILRVGDSKGMLLNLNFGFDEK